MIQYLPNILFALVFLILSGNFIRNLKKLFFKINLGKKIKRNNNKYIRLKKMFLLAFGQSKMFNKPISAFLHLIVYIGFVIINIELVEIIIDGFFGTHRVFAPFMGSFYNFLIASFEILALLVLVSVFIFWTRRNLYKIKRFISKDLKGWPKTDANLILYFEVILMTLFLLMNAADYSIQQNFPNDDYYTNAGLFPVSKYLSYYFINLPYNTLVTLERIFWWMHIVGILLFANYLYYSKHLHILLAFPNTFYSNLNNLGKFEVLDEIKNEIKMIINPNEVINYDQNQPPEKFGASDVTDLTRIQLLNAYTCTECGRCTSECPANQTGKMLSPRKIMMDTRDRLDEVGRNIHKNGKFLDDGKQLLNDYIKPEELWACTSCNACVEVCPIDIDPLSIIINMRQYLIMEKSSAPNELNNMMSNIENNGAPWPFNQQDRLSWLNET